MESDLAYDLQKAYEMNQLKNTIDIYKLLNKSNCGVCHEKTCLAFAAAVFKGEKQLAECPYLNTAIIEQYEGNVEKLKTLEEDQDNSVQELKERVLKLDLAIAADNIGGTFSSNRLTVKIFGKDFSMDTSGQISTSIHINVWVTIPFLMHILNSNGKPVSNQWVPFRELSIGPSYQGLFEQRCEKPMKKVADTYTDLFEDLIHIFNGKKVENHYASDISLVVHPFPKLPMLICYWKPEDGLESDLHLFFDQTVEDHLPIEGIYGLCSGLVRMFEKLALRHGKGIPST